MVDGIVGQALDVGNDLVRRRFVRHQTRLAAEVGADDRHDVASARAIDVEAAGRAASLHKRKNHVLVRPSQTAFLWLAFKEAVERLVNFNRLAAAAERGQQAASAHCLTDAMRKKLCRFIGDAKRAVDLMGGNGLLARRHHVERLKPDVELDVAAFHHALSGDGEVLTAFLGAAAVANEAFTVPQCGQTRSAPQRRASR